MLVCLTRSNVAYELTPVNKQIAAKFKRSTGEESVLFQSDWDYPGLAQSLGWNIARAHKRSCPDRSGTDGTVTCRGCGRTAGHFIGRAQEYLDKRIDTVMRVYSDYFRVE